MMYSAYNVSAIFTTLFRIESKKDRRLIPTAKVNRIMNGRKKRPSASLSR